MRCRFLTGFGDVNDGEENSAGGHASLRWGKEIALQVITDDDKIPGRHSNFIFPLLEVSDVCVDLEMALGSAIAQDANGTGGAVDGCNRPAVRGEPQGVAASAAGKVQGPSGRKLFGDFDQERRGSGVEIFGGTLARAITLIPGTNFHMIAIAVLGKIEAAVEREACRARRSLCGLAFQ
jgi:hypothetical protein